MHLKALQLSGFKSFAKKTELPFPTPIAAIVGPNGSGKSNVAEAFRFVLGEQSIKSMRGKRGEDLIWNGSNAAPRASRAAVKVIFDNKKRLFNVDFDEVSIERAVNRDGTNEYAMNGSRVRLKDINETLSSANIGASGHHIISQGEADRALSAAPKERREMLEDALGLRVFEYKKDESIRKLEKTRENITQVESLRREIAPHLKFLEKQVEKIEKAKVIRETLRERYLEYLKRESLYLDREEAAAEKAIAGPKRELAELEAAHAKASKTLAEDASGDTKRKEVSTREQALSEATRERERLSQEASRLDGELGALERHLARTSAAQGSASVPLSDFEAFAKTLEVEGGRAQTLADVAGLKGLISSILASVRAFIAEKRKSVEANEGEEELASLKEKREVARGALVKAEALEAKERSAYEKLRREIEEAKDERRDAEREMFKIMAKESEVRGLLRELQAKAELLARERGSWKQELAEAGALLGRDALGYESVEVSDAPEPREAQEKRRRELERFKLKLEESGAGSAEEVMKEYQGVKERDEFLTREVADLQASAASLEELIKDLDERLSAQFSEGLAKVNREFERLFALMFGGGSASLTVVREEKRARRELLENEDGEAPEEEEKTEEGIEIQVSLPHKRIKGLQMLSGGERALTSIALIFALSQVNPPPFIILDETDAALDEANSKRYGDMIEALAEKSQLILITHNRETMSRAGILYGVTMGSDGVSKLLSVQFDEAVAVAK